MIKDKMQDIKTNKIIETKLEIVNDDAYKEIENLIDKEYKVDHIITDPPYNISKDNNFSTMKI